MRILAVIVWVWCLMFPFGSQSAAAEGDLSGAWEGSLKVGAVSLRLVAKIKRAPDGKSYRATMDSIDQGASDIPVDAVKVEGDTVTLSLPKIGGSYEGKLAGDTMKGTWKQGGAQLPLELKKTEHPATVGKARPQDPKRPLPYDELEVTIDAGKGVKLGGTLTRPRGAGKFPAVVMVTGSGAQDRDEALMGHRPFLVIADALTRKGIAVLRCDDRGVGKSVGDLKKATTFDFVDDALAQVAYLKTRPDIDAAHIGLVGHSEGGLIAPIAATKSKDVAFIVMLAGTGLTGEEILYLQGALVAKAAGKSDAEVKLDLELSKKAYAILKSEKDDAAAEKKLSALFDQMPAELKKDADNAPAAVKAQIAVMLSPWFRTFLTLDPRAFLKQVKVPVLALNGARDLQVPPKENLKEIRAALAGNPDVTLTELPELNHLFQHCKTGSPSEYATIDETFAPVALDAMAEWIGKHVKR
jgi:fermentation-respiration switch protein FrsA (DUF1100 family)